MVVVTSRKLKREIMKNFRDFLVQKVKSDPKNRNLKDLLKKLK